MGSTAERDRAFLHARILSSTSGECVMAFKQTRGKQNRRKPVSWRCPVERSRAMSGVTIQRGSQTISKLIGRDAGRPVATEGAAMELAGTAARRELAR